MLNSSMTLNINNHSFIITKAHIKESLEDIFVCECEGFYENLKEDILDLNPHSNNNTPFPKTLTNNNPNNSTFNPNAFIDKMALLSIANPYPSKDLNLNLNNKNNDKNLTHNNLMNNSTHNSINNPLKDSFNPKQTKQDINTQNINTGVRHYKGIITHIVYQGTYNAQSLFDNSSSNLNNKDNSSHNLSLNSSNLSSSLSNNSSLNSSHNSSNNLSNNNLKNSSNNNLKNNNLEKFSYKHYFSFTLKSPLIRLSLNKANRLYTNMSVIEVIKHTLSFYKNLLEKNLDFKDLKKTYASLELITQYKESDLDFISRLAHNNGIYFYEDEHSIYFKDSFFNQTQKLIDFNANISNNVLNAPCINALFKEQSLKTNAFTHTSINPQSPLEVQGLTQAYPQENHHTNFNDTSVNNTNFNDTSKLNANTHNNLNQTYPLYEEHSFTNTVSFNENDDLKQLIHLKERRLKLLDESLQAQSNIYHLSLNESIALNFNQQDKDLKTKDDLWHNTTRFTIIALEHSFIDEGILNKDIKDLNLLSAYTHQTNELINKDKKTSNLSVKSYTNKIKLIPSYLIFTPSLKPKPKPPLNTTGIIIGKSLDIESERNTLYTDEYGRVKVRLNAFINFQQQTAFQNDLNPHSNTENNLNNHSNNNLNSSSNNPNNQNTLNDNTKSLNNNNLNTNDKDLNENLSNHQTQQLYCISPFLRVATPVASHQSGFYHTPRVADEVIISYLDEDIDKPYVSASLYNAYNPSLIHLPKNDHQTSISSKTIGKDEKGYNEITLSNEKDKEQIYLKAQKDYDELIGHNFTQKINNDKDALVEGHYKEHINKTHSQNISLMKNVFVGGEYLTNVVLSKDTQVGLSHTLNVGASNKLRVAKDSSEYIGGDKEVIIKGSAKETVDENETLLVRGNKVENVGNEYNIIVNDKLNLESNNETTIKTKGNLLLTSNASMGIETDKNATFVADNLLSQVESDYDLQAGNTINLQINDTTITASKDKIILKAGGVEVVIDSNGLVVRGGEIKGE